MAKEDEFKEYPEIGQLYRHYKGGKYKVISMVKHSEEKEIKALFEELLSKDDISEENKQTIRKLKDAVGEDLVLYKSVHYRSFHVRPLKLWNDAVDAVVQRLRFLRLT